MSQFGSRARAFFDRVFPERQIYHRSGGTVRYVSLSPGKQALLALGGGMPLAAERLAAAPGAREAMLRRHFRLLGQSYFDLAFLAWAAASA